ncbi:MAG: methionyl-tRNA formyltransferase [Parcubacteria group bacterium]|nr:methionyl-tRNA formyltransferase [Parcubacteria group bacterium]
MTNLNPKIIFIGTGQFAVPILEKLINSDYKIITVITAPDKPAGRKQEITPPPIKQIAIKYNLSVSQPEKISNFESQIADLFPDLIITADYSQIIPKNILDIPKLGCLNLHPSLLPKYRGPSPIQTAILKGEELTGITIMLMDEKMDHGPIIVQEQIPIDNNDNCQTLEEKLSEKTSNLLIKTLPQYVQSKIKPISQDHNKATYTKIFTRQDGQIDWKQNAKQIERMIRAFYPWPGTWAIFNEKRVKILKAKAVNQQDKAAIKTKKGYLLLELVQPAGKKPMTGQEFARGYL